MTCRHAQRGVALLAMVAVLVLGGTFLMLRQLSAASVDHSATKRVRNAAVLNQAKEALIGHMAMLASKAGEDDPGRLPCPEPAAVAGSALEGATTGACATAVGRFPWRTVGTPKLYDADGEPLWLVVSPGWAKASISGNLTINPDSVGQLTVDGQANAAVALIIAAGPAMNVAENPGCSARAQVRGAPSPGINVLDFLECFNSGTATYATVGPTASFNDQVVKVTVADLMPVLEASIAQRLEREIAPALRTVFVPPAWGIASGSNPVYPFAAPFDNPATATYRGAAGTTAGLLPFNQVAGCNPASDPRCAPATFLAFSKALSDMQTGGAGSIRTQSTCNWDADDYVCTGEYNQPSIAVGVIIRITNVAMGLRTFDDSQIRCTAVDDAGGGIGQQTVSCTTLTQLQADGSLGIGVLTSTLPDIAASGWGTYARYSVRIPRTIIGDHALLDSTNATTGWFVRNGWYRYIYYAVANGHTAAALPGARSCTDGTNCLTVASNDAANPLANPDGQRAILILAGRSINGSARPSSSRGDYFEFGNATGSYVREPVRKRVLFNDRIVSVAAN